MASRKGGPSTTGAQEIPARDGDDDRRDDAGEVSPAAVQALVERVEELEEQLERTHDVATTAVAKAQTNEADLEDLGGDDQ
jgi:hypothetical protein